MVVLVSKNSVLDMRRKLFLIKIEKVLQLINSPFVQYNYILHIQNNLIEFHN